MPPTTSKPAPKRKAPSFKPPRPASKAQKTTKAPRPKSAPTAKRGGPSFIADEASASDDDDPEEEDDDNDVDSMPSIPSRSATPSNTSTPIADPSMQDPPPTIPPALLTKLLHHHFKDDKMRIRKDANGVVGRYMETFVREAIARAAFERSEAVERGEVAKGIAGEFLEVEDLEKLAPQLLLDF